MIKCDLPLQNVSFDFNLIVFLGIMMHKTAHLKIGKISLISIRRIL